VLGGRFTASSQVYEVESRILGSTDVGSRVQIRVQPTQSMLKEASEGLTVLPAQTKGYALKHKGFIPNSEFRIILSTHPLDHSGVLAADSDLLKAVFLMAHLSGLGRRSRRGSGNLRVLDAKGHEGQPELAILPENRDELVTYLKQVGNYISPKTHTIGRKPSFPVFAWDTAVVLLGQQTHANYDDAFDKLWSISGPYHHEGGIFGDVRPRRASAIHMRVGLCRTGYVAQQTILYTGNGQWGQMQDYIHHCLTHGFDAIYGTWGHWL